MKGTDVFICRSISITLWFMWNEGQGRADRDCVLKIKPRQFYFSVHVPVISDYISLVLCLFYILWLLKDNNILTEWDLERKNSCWKLIQWRVRQILTQSSLSVWWWQQCESSDSQTSLPTLAGQRGQYGVLLPPPWSAVDWGEVYTVQSAVHCSHLYVGPHTAMLGRQMFIASYCCISMVMLLSLYCYPGKVVISSQPHHTSMWVWPDREASTGLEDQ